MGFRLDGNEIFIYEDEAFSGVQKIAGRVRDDLSMIFDRRPGELKSIDLNSQQIDRAIIFGTIGKSPIIEELSAKGIVHKKELEGKWEVFELTKAVNPIEGVREALIIAGSDKRGTIYGLFELSNICKVSPFVDWSDALPPKRDFVEIKDADLKISKEPSVKYRGIFINDEWPAFGNWAVKRFNGVNAECYSHVFEMILRLRGNYMWPAMWATNFSMDGPGVESCILADELGIVMSTSHHEPCMRTGEEYRLLRGADSPYGDAWDFISNREGITRFWEDGLKRNAPFENVYTMGMRGERDTAIMANATIEENIALLKDIIRTQNELLKKYVNPDLKKIPRQLVLFTEVEKFYYGDGDVPGLIEDPELDGITVMFSDDNYGYTRTLPTAKMLSHEGGYGLYYHVDMHGGAYSYEWIGSTYLPRIWDQLSTAYDYGVNRIWVVNVGDIMTQELEISYIMNMAYDMESFGIGHPNETEKFLRSWTELQFGGYFEADDIEKICDVIFGYFKILERRKHEIMNEYVYHPVHFGEAAKLYEECDRIMNICDELLLKCPERIKTAFYELVYYPAVGSVNLMKTWIASEWNKF